MLLRHLLQSLDIIPLAIDMFEVGSWWKYYNVSNPFTRLFYIDSGGAVVRHSGKEFGLLPGSLFITPPFTQADYICEKEMSLYFAHIICKLDGGFRLFNMREFPFLLQGTQNEEAYFEKLIELNPERKLPVVDPKNPKYQQFHSNIEHTLPNQPLENMLETQAILRFLITPFIKSSKERRMISEGNVSRIIQLMEFIDKNMHRPLTLQDMASQVGVHPTYLSDMFMNEMGIRPVRYLNQKRIEHAQLLLTTTIKAIDQVASECGFSDAKYFHRVFKKTTGTTPLQYQKNLM